MAALCLTERQPGLLLVGYRFNLNGVHFSWNSDMESTRWGDRAAKRRNILRAARQLLDEGGFDAVSIRRVAECAGVSPGTVYTQFARKEELFATLYVERLEVFLAEVEAMASETGDLEQLAMQMGRRYVDVYATFGRELDAWSMMVAPQDWPEALVRQLMDVTLRLLGQIDRVARELGLQSLPAETRRKAGALFWSTLNGLAEQYSGVRHRLHGVPLDEMLAFATRVLVAGLRDIAERE